MCRGSTPSIRLRAEHELELERTELVRAAPQRRTQCAEQRDRTGVGGLHRRGDLSARPGAAGVAHQLGSDPAALPLVGDEKGDLGPARFVPERGEQPHGPRHSPAAPRPGVREQETQVAHRGRAPHRSPGGRTTGSATPANTRRPAQRRRCEPRCSSGSPREWWNGPCPGPASWPIRTGWRRRGPRWPGPFAAEAQRRGAGQGRRGGGAPALLERTGQPRVPGEQPAVDRLEERLLP